MKVLLHAITSIWKTDINFNVIMCHRCDTYVTFGKKSCELCLNTCLRISLRMTKMNEVSKNKEKLELNIEDVEPKVKPRGRTALTNINVNLGG